LFEESDLIAGDFLFMRRYMPANLKKNIATNTITKDNIALLKKRDVKTVIITMPRYDGRALSAQT
jgi:hypothetical protein